MKKNSSLRKIKKLFEQAQIAKQAGQKKKAIKALDKAINNYLKMRELCKYQK